MWPRCIEPVHDFPVGHDEGVVIGTMPHEILVGIRDAFQLFGDGRPVFCKVHGISDLETDLLIIKLQHLFQVFGAETEMTKTPDLEWPVEQHTADIEFFLVAGAR